MVRKYLNQDYRKLKRDHQRRGELFTDPRFPPEASSVFISGQNDQDIVWKRPRELYDDPHLVVKGLSASDLNQGELGNCWFVAACSGLALEKKLWDKVVPNAREQEWDSAHPENYAGIFHFHFWRFGEWVDVVVDDWLPTKNGKLVYMTSKDGNEFWSALLEKAYAKLAGSYEALAGGLTGDALVDFTGGVSETIKLLRTGGLSENDAVNHVELFDNLLNAHDHQAMISCSIKLKEDDPPEAILDCGLVKGHAYTVTNIRKMKLSSGLMSLFKNREQLMMVQLRNPWGKKEWNGPWSDSSDEWDRVPKSEKEKMGLKVDDDGQFWMEFHDVCQWFTDVSICRIVNTRALSLQKSWHEYSFHGKWEGRTAGGCVNNRETFLHNPQYLLTVKEDQEAMMSIMQKDTRKNQSLSNLSIGYSIMKVEENRVFRIHTIREEAGSVQFINRRSVFGRFNLPQGQYVVIPSTFEPAQEREFLLRVFTESNVHTRELKMDVPSRGISGILCCCCVRMPIAMVTVCVHNAHGLEKQGRSGADAYCKVTCEGKTVTTPVKKDTVDPQFECDMVFYVKRPDVAEVKVQVYNRNIMRDAFLGQVVATLPVADTGGERRTLKLVDRNNAEETHGSLVVTITQYSDLRAT